MKHQLLRNRLEFTLAMALFFVLCYAAFCGGQQEQLSEDVFRLRVVAHSDSNADQAVKLRVRDRVLALVQPLEEQADSQADMQRLLEANIQDITNAAQEEIYACGGAQLVTARLAREWYPTRDYGTFALPAGWYTGLQVRIGDAAGHNWWCVLYPSLCVSAAEGDDALTEEERKLIYREDTGCEIRFRTAELLGNLRGLVS